MQLLEHVLADFQTIRLIPAVQGLVGIELAQRHHPDLILLDLHLPDVSGDQILKRLKEDPLTANVPVVVLSADATNRQIEAILAEGAADYLTKPFNLQRLFAVLKKYLPEDA